MNFLRDKNMKIEEVQQASYSVRASGLVFEWPVRMIPILPVVLPALHCVRVILPNLFRTNLFTCVHHVLIRGPLPFKGGAKIILPLHTRGHVQNFMGDSRGGERDHYLEQVRGEAGSDDESSEDEDFNPEKASGGSDVDEEYVAGRAVVWSGP